MCQTDRVNTSEKVRQFLQAFGTVLLQFEKFQNVGEGKFEAAHIHSWQQSNCVILILIFLLLFMLNSYLLLLFLYL
jgi:hypothetical protein